MKQEVTVIIPSYNPGRYLIDALNSVFLQTYKGWNIILVDDASTDDSLNHVRDYLSHENVKLVKNKLNCGQSKCMNIALSKVRTPYVIQLDADDWLNPNSLEILLAQAKEQPDTVALISGNINIIIEDEMGNISNSWIIKNRSFYDKYDYLLANVSQWPRFYRTSALKSIGGWPTDDPYEGRYMEDKRVLTRLIERYHFHWIDVTLYNHRRHENNQTNLTNIYQDITEWNVYNALWRWGDIYDPVFQINEGWLMLVGLNPK